MKRAKLRIWILIVGIFLISAGTASANTNFVSTNNFPDKFNIPTHFAGAVFYFSGYNLSSTQSVATLVSPAYTIDEMCVLLTSNQPTDGNMTVQISKNGTLVGDVLTIPANAQINTQICTSTGQNLAFNGTSDTYTFKVTNNSASPSSFQYLSANTLSGVNSFPLTADQVTPIMWLTEFFELFVIFAGTVGFIMLIARKLL